MLQLSFVSFMTKRCGLKNVKLLILMGIVSIHTIFGQNTELIPFDIGNYWISVDSSEFGLDTVKTMITNKMTVTYQNHDYVVYAWESVDMITNQPDDLTSLYNNDENGLWEYGLMTPVDTFICRNHAFKFPASVGDTSQMYYYFLNNDSVTSIDSSKIECIAKNEKFESPAGTFACHVYYTELEYPTIKTILPLNLMRNRAQTKSMKAKSNKGQLEEHYYYLCPNIGIIGMIGKFEDEVYFKYTLLDYELVSSVKPTGKPNFFLAAKSYPNPFSEKTKITFQIKQNQHLQIDICDVNGKIIRTLVNKAQASGKYETDWNGTNANGLPVSKGVYFSLVTLENGFKIRNKIIKQ